MPDETKHGPEIYANVFEAQLSPYDMTLDFGYKSPEDAKKGSPEWSRLARLTLSLSHAKHMAQILTALISTYERDNGTIPIPGQKPGDMTGGMGRR